MPPPSLQYSSVESLDDDDATITSSHSPTPKRAVYYNDGPFDAPSSDDEDEVPFLDKTESIGRAERGYSAAQAEPQVCN